MSGLTLITGGLGYVGGRIALNLLAQGVPIRLSSRRPPERWPDWARAAEFAHADVSSDDDLDDLCRGVETVIHLAAMNEHESLADPAGAVAVNAIGTVRLLQACERAGVGRIVYVSTAHVYGAPLAGSINERTLPRPVHPYAISHRIAEDFVLAAHDEGRIAGLVFRLSNGVGAPADAGVERWTLVANDLCRQAVTTQKLVLQTDGWQQRDFIALADVARAVAHVLALPAGAWGDGLFNLGGETTLSVLELAERIAARGRSVLGVTAPIERPARAEASPPPDLDYRIDKLKATGFVLEGRLDDEIDRTLRLCKSAFAGADA